MAINDNFGINDIVIALCDINSRICEEWRVQFEEEIGNGHVEVFNMNIFDVPGDGAIVSPANSLGFMDGGVDLAISHHFGWHVQSKLQEIIRTRYNGELLVGQAVCIETESGDERHPYVISAPTMRGPQDVRATANAYLAFRAVLFEVIEQNKMGNQINRIMCTGLGTAVGRLSPDRAAYQMKEAYSHVKWRETNQALQFDDVGKLAVEHHRLMRYVRDISP